MIKLLEKLLDLGIKLKLDDAGNLKLIGKKENLTSELIGEIKKEKQSIVEWLSEQTRQDLANIVKIDERGELSPTSFSQQRLWFIDQLQGGTPEYHMPVVFDVSGDLNISLLNDVLTHIIDRHEVLRTTYIEAEGEAKQRILPMSDVHFAIDVQDFQSLSPETRTETVKAQVEREIAKPFNLADDIMLRVCYLQTDADAGVLVFNMHHIASDGWSMEVLTNEFFALYESFSAGKPSPLPALGIQYADYAHWQRTHIEGEVLDKQLAYWEQQLADIPSVHSLPLSKPRQQHKQYVGAIVKGSLPAYTSQLLQRLAKQHQLTPFMLLHGALALLLARHSNSTDIVIGTPVANRLQQELAPLIGFFVNTQVLRANTNHETLADYLTHIRQIHFGAQSNQDVPFEQLVERLKIPRSTAHTPLFQLMMTTESDYGMQGDTDFDSVDLPGVNFKPFQSQSVQSKFDMNIDLSISEAGVGILWTYDVSLFDAQFIVELNNRLCRLLTGLSEVTDSTISLNTLPLLSDSELQFLIHDVNETASDLPQRACLHELFEQQAALTPDKVAVVFEGATLSYQVLNDKANALAHHLINKHAVKPGTLVGLCTERSFDMVIGILGIMKAGGAYVPIDPNYPQSRIDYIIADASLKTVVSHAQTNGALGDFAGQTIALDYEKIYAEPHTGNIATSTLGLSSTSLAYVIYTSGSTGKPKGVLTEHGALMNFSAGFEHQLQVCRDYKNGWLWLSSFIFDASLKGIALLANGVKLVVPSQAQMKSPESLVSLIETQDLSVINATPQLLELIVKQPNLKALDIISSGEKMGRTTFESLQAYTQAHNTTFINAYGPTETTVNSCYAVQNKLNKELIGKPMRNTTCYVLDRDKNIVPLGTVGELHIGGMGLARGYLNRPELTADCFIDNPYYDANRLHSSKRLYRTGDLVRHMIDGNLEFVGRDDDQVKIRGFRIELGEIEAQLSALENVDSGVVLVKEVGENQQLVGYFKSTQAIEKKQVNECINEIKASLANVVPDYMVPSFLVPMDEWPLTASGKIDKQALPAPDGNLSQHEYVAPANETEQGLVEIWSQLLGIEAEKISTASNFFELGGHSLLSIRLVAGIRARFAVEVPVQVVFDAPTLADLSVAIESHDNSVPVVPIEVIERVQDHYDVSFAQQRLWFMDKLQGGTPEYNMPMAFNVPGSLDMPLLNQVFMRIIERHEILRTVYIEVEGEAKQRILDISEVDFSIKVSDLRHLTGETKTKAVRTQVEAEAAKVFDLAHDLMLRATYLRTSEETGVLVFTMHHIASDGWSMEVLTKEFIALYDALGQDKAEPLPAITVQYADYAHWQRTHIEGEVLDGQLNYWQTQLADLPPVHSLPLSYPRPDTKQHAGGLLQGHLSADVGARLSAIAKQYRLTPFMLLHGIVSLLLSRHSNNADIVVGTPVANRLQDELAPLIGFFVNTLVLRVDTNHESLPSYFEHIRQVHLDAQANQDVPFEQLVERLKAPRSTAHTPLFQIMMTTNTDYGVNQRDAAAYLSGMEITPYDADSVQEKFDLNIDISLKEEGVGIFWSYDLSLFDADAIARLNTHLCQLLTGLSEVSDFSVAPHQLPMISAQEHHHLVVELNDTSLDYQKHHCIHELFEQQVQVTADQTAVIYEDSYLTYRALNERANQLAHYLVETQGVQPDTLVGLCVERSLDMVVGILGILKAGCAYVPLDPSYPQSRLDYMLEDAALKTIVSHKQASGKLGRFLGEVIDLGNTALLKQYNSYNIAKSSIGLTSSNLAYLIYTSGSTGNPKGVMVEHHSVCNLIASQQVSYGFESNRREVGILLASYAFDASVEQIFLMLLSGGQLVIPRKEVLLSAEGLSKCIFSNKVSHVDSTPSHLLSFVPKLKFENVARIVSGGEPFIAQLMDYIRADVFNVYGPTEACVTSHVSRLNHAIGKGVGNSNTFVLSDKLELVVKGAVGELYIGGAGLARGYLNRPDLTAERFIDNPYYDENNSNSSKRLYRTGDLVRYLPDNNLEFIGRVDDQVKIRGFRIELGEVESQLAAQAEVDSALVMAKELAGSQQLVGYIKPTHELEVSSHASLVSDVKASLLSQLPNYMVPSMLIVVNEWPLTPNDKIDRKALPEPDSNLLLGEYVGPQSKTEKALVEMWSELLGVDANIISTTSNFFELGGHSLMVVRSVAMIKQKFSVSLEVATMFDSPDIQKLAESIDRKIIRMKFKRAGNAIEEDEVRLSI
ncbi:amino acid adenylation domain-containing protein [Pseudoalteromonas sp. SMS1]|uniref:non-ribosomal peptide synthetase n=1 Tax=Pseudoalteromonas sp. SMS1 TaxID=2908894 RepID=UPI001F2BB37A|nr:non-ribosomal peptide synthetase [Pseudoalteromonas sp. SMS1]MCF2858429.1 amino acid adenylation domain-containing protein [Pseudoalteromonas sp. SMS1]